MKQIFAESVVERRFEAFGFHEKSLDQLELPEVQYAQDSGAGDVPYAVYGDLDAPRIIFATSPYGCRVDDASQMVRLRAQQVALGEQACVVGLHVYDPKGLELSRSERKLVASGSFRPYADRVLTVAQAVKPKDDQEVILYGFSMGADVSIETTFQSVTDEHRGVVHVNRLGAVEPARTVKRGSIAVAQAFAASGPDLFENVLAANSPALLEARDIHLNDSKAKKKHDAAVAKGVAKDYFSDIPGGIANMRGFANDVSLVQVNEMIDAGVLPQTVLGRVTRSTICPREAFQSLHVSENLETFSLPGDHSLADDVRKSAAMIIRATLL